MLTWSSSEHPAHAAVYDIEITQSSQWRPNVVAANSEIVMEPSMERTDVTRTEQMRKWLDDPRQIPVADLRGMARTVGLVLRNWHWARSNGWAAFFEEHDLNPVVRVPRDTRKLVWRLSHGVAPGDARPVLLLGAQRSGTNMVTHGLAMAPEFAVYNEGDRRAFDRYRLRDQQAILELVTKSRHQYVLFKPILDSHRAVELLDGFAWIQPPRALWVYRDVRSRAHSAVAKFGDSNLRVLRRRQETPGFRHWQLGGERGLSAESAALLDAYDARDLSAAEGAALFWLVRNRIVFEQHLDERDDVLVVSYESFLRHPEATMAGVCRFLEFPFRDALVAHVERRPPPPGPRVEIRHEILHLCDELSRRLARVGETV